MNGASGRAKGAGEAGGQPAGRRAAGLQSPHVLQPPRCFASPVPPAPRSGVSPALEHAAALAQWQSETLGVSVEGSGYRFWRRADDGRWAACSSDDVLAARALPPGMTVRPLTYAGAPLAADAIVPLRPSGRNEPYTLGLDSASARMVIASDPLIRVGYASAPDAAGGGAAPD